MVPSNYLLTWDAYRMRTYQGLHVPLIPWKHHFFFLNLFVTVPFNSGDISPSFAQINCNNVPYFTTWMILFALVFPQTPGRRSLQSFCTDTNSKTKRKEKDREFIAKLLMMKVFNSLRLCQLLTIYTKRSQKMSKHGYGQKVQSRLYWNIKITTCFLIYRRGPRKHFITFFSLYIIQEERTRVWLADYSSWSVTWEFCVTY